MLQDGRNDGVVFENETTLVMIDSDWVVLGHVLIFWKKHVENISDLTSDEYQNFSHLVYRTESILKQVLGRKKFVILKSGGFVSHFHFHIYPVDAETTWEQLIAAFEKKSHERISTTQKVHFTELLSSKFGQLH